MAIVNFKFKEGAQIRIPFVEGSGNFRKVTIEIVSFKLTFVRNEQGKIECFSHEDLFSFYMKASKKHLNNLLFDVIINGLDYLFCSRRREKSQRDKFSNKLEEFTRVYPLVNNSGTPPGQLSIK